MELLDGEKLVDGVRRRVRALAEHAGQDPDAYEAEHFEALRTGRIKARSVATTRLRTMCWRWWRWLRYGDGREEILDLGEIMETLMAVHGDQAGSGNVAIPVLCPKLDPREGGGGGDETLNNYSNKVSGSVEAGGVFA